jgi:hypothetical protein
VTSRESLPAEEAAACAYYVHRDGRHEAEVIETSEDSVIAGALDAQAEDVAVLLEDADDELDPVATLAAAGVADLAHVFVGRRRRIEAVVAYNGERRERAFGLNTRVDRVFRWAVGRQGFDLGREDAAEHTLAQLFRGRNRSATVCPLRLLR